jgi:hypothetical protein
MSDQRERDHCRATRRCHRAAVRTVCARPHSRGNVWGKGCRPVSARRKRKQYQHYGLGSTADATSAAAASDAQETRGAFVPRTRHTIDGGKVLVVANVAGVPPSRLISGSLRPCFFLSRYFFRAALFFLSRRDFAVLNLAIGCLCPDTRTTGHPYRGVSVSVRGRCRPDKSGLSGVCPGCPASAQPRQNHPIFQ